MQNKQGNFRDAEDSASKALAVENIKDADKAKAHFRRGVAKSGLKDDDAALEDLKRANDLVPGDAAVVKELDAVKKRIHEKAAKQKAKLKNFFGSGN